MAPPYSLGKTKGFTKIFIYDDVVWWCFYCFRSWKNCQLLRDSINAWIIRICFSYKFINRLWSQIKNWGMTSSAQRTRTRKKAKVKDQYQCKYCAEKSHGTSETFSCPSVSKCWVDLSFNSRVSIVFLLSWNWAFWDQNQEQ